MTSPIEDMKSIDCHTTFFDPWTTLLLSQPSPLTSMTRVLINDNTMWNNIPPYHWWKHHQTLMLTDVSRTSLDMYQTPLVIVLEEFPYLNVKIPPSFFPSSCQFLHFHLQSSRFFKIYINVCILSPIEINTKGPWLSIKNFHYNMWTWFCRGSLGLSSSICHICQCLNSLSSCKKCS